MIYKRADYNELQIKIEFYLIPGETFMETHGMMKHVYGNQCMGHTHYYEWFK